MTTKPVKADDDFDALEALESEEKEYLKVSLFSTEARPQLDTDMESPLRMPKLIVFLKPSALMRMYKLAMGARHSANPFTAMPCLTCSRVCPNPTSRNATAPSPS